MSIIVYSPEEKLIIADRFIMKTNQIRPGMAEVDVEHGCKIHISEDKHFAYCFEVTEELKYLPVIFNFIKRYETGQLQKDEKLELADAPSFALGIMTRRHFYLVDTKVNKNKITIQHVMWSNHYDETVLMKALRLPALKVWQTIQENTNVAHSGQYDVVRAEKLTLIKKPTKKSAAAAVVEENAQ